MHYRTKNLNILKITYTFLLLIITSIFGFSQNHSATISIVGETQKRIDKYSKTYKIKKRHNTSPLEKVDIRVTDSHNKLIINSKSDSIGIYNINFNLDPNQSYTVSFSKNGYYLKLIVYQC